MNTLKIASSLEDISSSIGENETCFVVFYADWCKPCRDFHQTLEEITKHTDIHVVKVSVDLFKEYAMAEPNKVSSIPATVVNKNKEKMNKCSNQYKKNNKEKIKEYQKQWRKTNRYKITEYNKNKRYNDINFRIAHNLRSRIKSVLKSKNSLKANKTIKLIGCSIDFLKNYLESKFKSGMTWENYGYSG